MTLDLGTLHFASAASRCAYVCVFLVMALSQRRQTHLWQWMGAMAASMTGSLIMMRVPPDALPPVPITMAVYSLYGASLVLSWTGLRSFFGRRVSVGLGVGLVALPGVLYPSLLWLGASTRLSIAAIFASCLLVAVLATYETSRRPADFERLWSQYIEAVVFGVYAIIFLLTIVMLIGTDLPVASAESARISMVVDQVTGVFVYFGYVAMAAERAQRSLLNLAERDPLTGLSNRRGLQATLRRRFPSGEASAAHPGSAGSGLAGSGLAGSGPAGPGSMGPGWTGGVLILDIDHFKSINDRHGHEAGDAVLEAFAARIKAHIRAADLAARWGGEEFLVVLPGADATELLGVAERLRAGIGGSPFALPTGALSVTVSIGAALMAPDDADFDAVIRRADAALYAAKAQGRDRVCRAPETDPPRPDAPPSADDWRSHP